MIFEIRKDDLFSNPFRKSTGIGKRATFLSLKALFQIVTTLKGLAGVSIVLGLASFVLFVASEDASSTGSLLSYAGFWQRLFLLNHYFSLGVISAIMYHYSL